MPAKNTGNAQQQPEADDTKRRFREALERKHSSKKAGRAQPAGSKVSGSRGAPAAGKRQFRRKTG